MRFNKNEWELIEKELKDKVETKHYKVGYTTSTDSDYIIYVYSYAKKVPKEKTTCEHKYIVLFNKDGSYHQDRCTKCGMVKNG